MNKKYKMLSAKIMTVLVTICLLFTACGGQGQGPAGGANGTAGSVQGEQPDQTPNPKYLGMDQSAFENHVDQSTISVELIAGAILTLYLDENGTILAAHCHNDEAIAVCSATPVLEVAFESVWFAILNEMLAKGYLENGSRITMNIVEEEGSAPQFPLYDVIDEMFQKVVKDSGADIGMNMNSDLGSVGAVIQGGGNTGGEQRPDDGQRPDQGGQRPDQGGQQPDQGDQQPNEGQTSDEGEQHPEDDRYLEVERDENGNLIRTVEMDAQGNQVECFYRPDGTRETVLVRGTDGFEELTVFRADGTVESRVETHPDGTKTETIMNKLGNWVSMTQIRTDGTLESRTFTDDGRDLYHKMTLPDGSYREEKWEYDASGRLVVMNGSWSDGRMQEERFHGNGMVSIRIEREANGETTTSTFTQNGNMLSCVCVLSDGTVTNEERYEYDEKEVLISKYQKNPDGSYNVTTYYANGNRKTEEIFFRDGMTEIWHYTEDGTTGTMTTSAGTTTEIYHANGSVAKRTFTTSPSAGFDFTYEEFTYDENGTMLTHTKIQNSGVIGVSTYHYDKSHTTVFTYPGGGGHTEYWYGNNLLGGIDSDGNAWGVTVPGADYSGLDYSGTIGKG